MSATFAITIPAGPSFDPRLRLTLESLRGQNVNVNVALCDASNDSRVKALAGEYKDIIKYVRHGPDLGQSAAINEGWNALEGQFYSWLNVDDYLAPNALALVLGTFETKFHIDVVYGQSLMERDGHFVGLHHEVQPPSDYLYRSNIISQPSCFVRKKALFESGLVNEDLHFTMDWDLWARLMQGGSRFYYEKNVFSVVALGQNTKTSQFNTARLSEIKSILAQNNGPLAAYKSIMAMRLNHSAEYGMLGCLIKQFIRFMPHRKMQVKPFEIAVAESQSTLKLPLFHFAQEPKTHLTLRFKNRKDRVIRISGEAPVYSNAKVVEMKLSLNPARVMILEIETNDQTSTNLWTLTLK